MSKKRMVVATINGTEQTLLCDNRMSLLDALREARPDLPAVLMSGYSEQQLRRPLEGRSRVVSLQKPFRAAALAAALLEVLDA